MRRTKFQRVVAIMLALVFLLCGAISTGAVAANPDQGAASSQNTLLDLDSYGKYSKENAEVPNATEVVPIPVDGYTFTLNGKTYTKDSVVADADKKEAALSAERRYYKVRQGDYLGKIAARNHTTVAAICRLNGIKPTAVLQIGKVLRVK